MPKTQFPQQKKNRTSPKRVLSAAVALIVAFLLLTSVVGLVEKYIAIRGRVKELKDEQEHMLEKQASLKEVNRYIETDEGKEYELRSKYNVVKPGEGMIVVTEPQQLEAEKKPNSRVGRWWESLLQGLGVKKE